MAYNYELHQKYISKLNKELIKDAIVLCYKDGITSTAMLGCSGDDIVLFGDRSAGRKSIVSVRNYCGDAELLVTDTKGRFLYFGRYDINLGLDFVINEYWRIIRLLKPFIKKELIQKTQVSNINIPENKFDDKGYHLLASIYANRI